MKKYNLSNIMKRAWEIKKQKKKLKKDSGQDYSISLAFIIYNT